MWSSHVGPLDQPVRPMPPEQLPTWKLHSEAARAGSHGIYKTRGASSLNADHWDPYDESQSTESRVRAARRKPRPHRSPAPSDGFDVSTGRTDPYAVLGISPMASLGEIERAYRLRVSAIHPDKFHSDPIGKEHAHEQLKQLNAAMKVFRDQRSRAQFDGSYASERESS